MYIYILDPYICIYFGYEMDKLQHIRNTYGTSMHNILYRRHALSRHNILYRQTILHRQPASYTPPKYSADTIIQTLQNYPMQQTTHTKY